MTHLAYPNVYLWIFAATYFQFKIIKIYGNSKIAPGAKSVRMISMSSEQDMLVSGRLSSLESFIEMSSTEFSKIEFWYFI